MVLYLRDRDAKIIQLIGSLNTDDFRTITSIASQLKLRCFPFIDFIGDTILNHKQLLELIKEITFLKDQKTAIKEDDLNILYTAALSALENPDYYLLINGE